MTSGSNGWMLWNPRNIYSQNGLKREDRKFMMTYITLGESLSPKEAKKSSGILESWSGLSYTN